MAPQQGRAKAVTAVVCAAFDPRTDAAVYRVRDQLRVAGVLLPDRPPHRPHLSLSAARVAREGIDTVVDVAANAAATHPPLPIALSEVGRFGRAGALWLGPAPSRGLAALQREVYRALEKAGWPPAFGERSAPRLWVPHCTLASRVPKPRLRQLQEQVRDSFTPIRGTVDALAVILVGGRGDVAHLPLAGPTAPRT